VSELESRHASARDLPAVTRDGVLVAIRANIEFPAEVERALAFGAQGIGLYRSEFLFLTRSPELPLEEDHYRTYVELAARVHPHPAVVRTLDLGGQKYFHQVLDEERTQPVLGLRGVRLCLRRPDLFLPQLRGLLRAAAVHDNLRVMLPLVTAAEEVRQIRELLRREAQQLSAAGVPVRPDLPLGVTVEVPAAAVASDTLAEVADFFSIGTNDLIQYALAVDRGNEAVAHLYQPLHPGVLRMVDLVLHSARRAGIPVAVCGEMAADPQSIGVLLGLGLREFSVQPRAVGAVREVVRALSVEEARRTTLEALKWRPTAEIEGQLQAPS
jgi:phosphotransferase system enzyme I (PtsI)